VDIRADIQAALPVLRAQAESLMTDTCTVRRDTGTTTIDPETLQEVPVYSTVHTGLKCKIQFPSNRATEVQIPGQQVAKSDLEWHIPIATTGVLTDDLVTMDTVDSVTGDPELVGKVFRVSGPFLKSYATARRFQIEEAS